MKWIYAMCEFSENVFVERLWRSEKYEDIYPKGYESLKRTQSTREKE